MEGTLAFTEGIRRCVAAGDMAGAGAAAVAGYRDATLHAAEALGYLGSMREAITRALGDAAPDAYMALTPELSAEMDDLDGRIEAALRHIGR